VLEGGAEMLAVLGNHDAGFADAQVTALGMPGRWYATGIGDVLFVALDSTMAKDPGQLAWLDQTLAQAGSDWVVVALHHPPFSAGVHGSDEEVRDAFVPLFEQYGVDLVLAGHDHDYQRSVPIGGVTYVVSGAGSKVRSTGSAEFTAESAATLHFVELAVWEDRIDITAIGLDGAFDRATVTHDEPRLLGASAYPLEGLFDEELLSGGPIVMAGLALLALTALAARILPAGAAVRAERAIVFTSTTSVMMLIAGAILLVLTALG